MSLARLRWHRVHCCGLWWGRRSLRVRGARCGGVVVHGCDLWWRRRVVGAHLRRCGRSVDRGLRARSRGRLRRYGHIAGRPDRDRVARRFRGDGIILRGAWRRWIMLIRRGLWWGRVRVHRRTALRAGGCRRFRWYWHITSRLWRYSRIARRRRDRIVLR